MSLPTPGLALTLVFLTAIVGGPVRAEAARQDPSHSTDSRAIVAPAVIDDQLEVSGDPVPAKAEATRMSVAVHISGTGPYRFLVDSGADRTVVGEQLAKRLALEPIGMRRLVSIAGTTQVMTVRVPRLEIGVSRAEGLVSPVLRERDMGAAGILGIDALAGQRISLDFDRREVTFQDPNRRPGPASPDEIVVTARRRNGQLILTEARVDDTSVAAVIDTGAQVTIGNPALLRRLSRSRSRVMKTVTLTAVTGQRIEAQALPVRNLTIGRAELGNVTIIFADLAPFKLFGLADRPALLLGTDVLSSFRRVGLDFGRRRVRFQLRP